MADTEREQYSEETENNGPKRFCAMPEERPREFDLSVTSDRARAIIITGNKWVNGTVLHYHFFRSPSRWTTSSANRQVVRDAFDRWKALGIGLDFKEVDDPDDAEIRIGFLRDDGHWSYLGRAVLSHGAHERTLNLDKGDNWGIDTATHEIGHSLGLPHEHQNPKAGIVWDESAVIAALAAPPNRWPEEVTRHNILRKINPDSVQGSDWDQDSIMHYPFEAGLILQPERFQNEPLRPAPGLSARDQEWIRTFYPPLDGDDPVNLRPFRSRRVNLEPGEQVNFNVRPDATRTYTIQTFGESDTVVVLFENADGDSRFVAGDDDSGSDRNARIRVKLFKNREYVLRVRLYYSFKTGDTAVMMW